MFCKKCGLNIGDNARFCPACGTAVESSNEPSKEVNNPSYNNITQSEEKWASAWGVETEHASTERPVTTINSGYSENNISKSSGLGKGKIALIACGAVAAIIVIAIFVASIGKGNSSKDYLDYSNRSQVGDSSVKSNNASMTNDELCGSWLIKINFYDMATIMSQNADSGQYPEMLKTSLDALKKAKTKASADMYLDFNSDGTYQYRINKRSFMNAYKLMMDDVWDYMREGGLYEISEQQGVSREKVDENLAAQGMTLDEYIDSRKALQDSQWDAIENQYDEDWGSPDGDGNYVLKEKYLYYLEGNKLYMTVHEEDKIPAAGYLTIEYSNNRITVKEDNAFKNSTSVNVGLLRGTIWEKQ